MAINAESRSSRSWVAMTPTAVALTTRCLCSNASGNAITANRIEDNWPSLRLLWQCHVHREVLLLAVAPLDGGGAARQQAALTRHRRSRLHHHDPATMRPRHDKAQVPAAGLSLWNHG